MLIGRSDVIWNYLATFLKIASSVLLLPLILRMMPAETVGVWTIFMTVTSLVALFDFGFNPSFTRNISYVFSGVTELTPKGYVSLAEGEPTVDYGLLKGLINSMRWFYSRMSLLLFFCLITLGTYYIHVVIKDYSRSHSEVYLAWFILCAVSTFSLFSQYYESLLQGMGQIKRSKQIVIVAQTVYLLIAALLILLKQDLVAIVAAQASSVLIIRILCYRAFFTKEMRASLSSAVSRDSKEVIKAIYPNAVKVGLTALGGFAVSRSAIVVGSLYLPLAQIGSYGITIQLIGIISALAAIYTSTYFPKISQYRIHNNSAAIKRIYLKGQLVLFGTFFICGFTLVAAGSKMLAVISSHTVLMPQPLILLALVITFLENNHSIAGSILLTGNEVPFFKASLISGAATVILLVIFLKGTEMELLGMVLAPGIAHLYNNWKWPYEVKKQLDISFLDIYSIIYPR